jgi:hypothetical protein
MTTTIHIHEDDWGLRTLHPRGAWSELAADLAAAEAAGEANRAPGGGWSEMHLIAPPALAFADVGLTPVRAAAIVAAHLPRASRFVATAGAGFTPGVHDPYGVYDDDPLAFGAREGFIKLDVRDGALAAIWFDLADAAAAAALRRAFEALDAETPCVIADYVAGACGSVRDGAFLDAYFTAVIGGPD